MSTDIWEEDDTYVEDEPLTMATPFEGQCIWTPVVPGSFELVMGKRMFKDDGKGHLIWRKWRVGTLNYKTGAVKLNKPIRGSVFISHRFAP